MTDTPETAPGTEGQDAGAAQDGAQNVEFAVISQYVRDLSFENPNAPQSFMTDQGKPNIDIKVDLNARRGSETNFEVVLKIRADARSEDNKTALFVAELEYAGLFHVKNVPNESLQPVLLIEAPRLLFPFARRILSDATRDGGFPPLQLDPIDFVALYRARVAAQQQQAEAGNAEDDPLAGPAQGNA